MFPTPDRCISEVLPAMPGSNGRPAHRGGERPAVQRALPAPGREADRCRTQGPDRIGEIGLGDEVGTFGGRCIAQLRGNGFGLLAFDAGGFEVTGGGKWVEAGRGHGLSPSAPHPAHELAGLGADRRSSGSCVAIRGESFLPVWFRRETRETGATPDGNRRGCSRRVLVCLPSGIRQQFAMTL